MRAVASAIAAVMLMAFSWLFFGCGGPPEDSPAWVVQEYLNAVNAKDAATAYAFLSGSEHDELPYGAFELCVDNQEDIAYTGLRVHRDGGRVYVQVLPVYGHFLMQEEGDCWRIDAVGGGTGGGACQDNLRTIDSAVMQFYAQNGRYPEDVEELVPDYLREAPECPLGGRYFLYRDEKTGTVRAFCPFGHRY